MPTFSPWATRWSMVSCAVSQPEPISTMTRSASGWPWYSKRPYLRPTTLANSSMAACTWSWAST